MSSRPIGVFDSGVGGLTVLSKLRQLLPNEDFLYFADTARLPYGRKPAEMIRQFAREIVEFFITKDVKAVVIACNTATSFALSALKTEFNFPIWGVVEAGVIAAKKVANFGDTIGIIGTNDTINSRSYQNLLEQSGFNVWAKACPLLAPLVEEGLADSDMAQVIIKHYLDDMPAVSCLILGCTHYPILSSTIRKQFKDLLLVDSSIETAKMVAKDLAEIGLLNKKTEKGYIKHLVTGDLRSYKHTAEIIGELINDTQQITDLSFKRTEIAR